MELHGNVDTDDFDFQKNEVEIQMKSRIFFDSCALRNYCNDDEARVAVARGIILESLNPWCARGPR